MVQLIVYLQGDWAGVWDTLTFHWGTQEKPSSPRLSSSLSCVDRTETWNLLDIADATSGCPMTVLVLVYSHSAVLCDCTPSAENSPEHQLPHWRRLFLSQGESLGYSFCSLCCLDSVFQINIHRSCCMETWLMMIIYELFALIVFKEEFTLFAQWRSSFCCYESEVWSTILTPRRRRGRHYVLCPQFRNTGCPELCCDSVSGYQKHLWQHFDLDPHASDKDKRQIKQEVLTLATPPSLWSWHTCRRGCLRAMCHPPLPHGFHRGLQASWTSAPTLSGSHSSARTLMNFLSLMSWVTRQPTHFPRRRRSAGSRKEAPSGPGLHPAVCPWWTPGTPGPYQPCTPVFCCRVFVGSGLGLDGLVLFC